MRPFALLCGASLTALSLVTLPAATARMPLDEVRAGMTGTGITVFEGSAREAFQVHVLGVLANVMGPRRNIIIARLAGGPLAETGVIQGMSGSPVYIDDRLVGAVSYSLGSFSKDAIAGITPIEEMVATDEAPVRAARRRAAPLPLPATRDGLYQVVRQAFERTQPFAERPVDVEADGFPAIEAGRLGTLLRPIATPLVLNGFVPEIHELWASAFDSVGFVTTIGGAAIAGAAQGPDDDAPLQPGDAVGASLIRGDLTMAGTGTVTMVEDGRVYAFGHPFYNLRGRAVPDDARPHHHAAAESRHLVEDRRDRRGARHHRSRSGNRDLRQPRPGPRADSGHGDASRRRPRPRATVRVRSHRRHHIHATPRVYERPQHVLRLDARDRREHLCHRWPGAPPRVHRCHVPQRVQRGRRPRSPPPHRSRCR